MSFRDPDIINNLKDPENQLKQRNSLLKTIKDVNQVIIRSKSKIDLLKDIIEVFFHSELFNFAFIITLDNENKPKNILTDESDNPFISNYISSLKIKRYPECFEEILRERQSIILEENMHICGNCNLSDQTNLKSLILFPIAYENNFYGIVYLSTAKIVSNTNDIVELLNGVISDVALVLYKMDLEKKRRETEEALRNSEEKYRLLSNNAKDLIYVHDLKGKILDVNDAVVSLLGYEKENFIGENVNKFVDNKQLNGLNKRVKKRFSGDKNSHLYELEVKDKYGNLVYLEVNSVAIVKNEKITAIHCVARDITERKRTEEALKDSERKYKLAYSQAEFYKDLFAHDIRNILQAISSGLQIMEISLNKVKKNNYPLEIIDIIKEQIKRGHRLVSNIKKLSEIDIEFNYLEPINLLPLLNHVILNVKNSFPDRKISFTLDNQEKSIKVVANELLEDLFENIFINAVIHNNNSQIKIDINVSKLNKNHKSLIEIEISDNAMGIKDSRKEEIFNRTPYNKDKSDGLGLGLSLVKRIIEFYSGEIWVENKVESDYTRGSKFVILLPES